jgi:hypothetical protein
MEHCRVPFFFLASVSQQNSAANVAFAYTSDLRSDCESPFLEIENVFNPFCAFALLYAAFAITAQLNIGHRHLLPIYPTRRLSCSRRSP